MSERNTPEIVSAAELSDWLCIEKRTVRDLHSRGLVIRVDRGRYDLQASILASLAHLRASAANRSSDGGRELTIERSRLARSQADAVAQRNAAIRSEYLDAAEAEARWAAVKASVRARMLAVPTDISRLLPLTPHHMTVIERAIGDALAESAP